MPSKAHHRNTMPAPPGHKPKRVLAVRMMVAQIAWLGGQVRWHEGRVAWESERGLVVPGTTDFTRAQRTLYKLQRYPVSAGLALGDAEAWIEHRAARLALAKRLRAIEAPDMQTLLRQARARDPVSVQRLADLLLAEALCINELPASPPPV